MCLCFGVHFSGSSRQVDIECEIHHTYVDISRLLFRDFVQQGMQGSYWFFLMSENQTKKQAPSYKIILALKNNPFRQSILVWTPSLNEVTQGPIGWGEWNQQSFDETTGSEEAWPGPGPRGDGWW